MQPYASAIYILDDAAIEQGRREYRSALNDYVACERSGDWPDYGAQPVTIGLPHWRQDKSSETWSLSGARESI